MTHQSRLQFKSCGGSVAAAADYQGVADPVLHRKVRKPQYSHVRIRQIGCECVGRNQRCCRSPVQRFRLANIRCREDDFASGGIENLKLRVVICGTAGERISRENQVLSGVDVLRGDPVA